MRLRFISHFFCVRFTEKCSHTELISGSHGAGYMFAVYRPCEVPKPVRHDDHEIVTDD
jgi:hypothetical protein